MHLMLLPSQTLGAPRKCAALLPAWGWVLTAIFIVQVAVAALFPVLPEEAYHWNFACHLDWGYYDHPPMLPWSIALSKMPSKLVFDSPGLKTQPTWAKIPCFCTFFLPRS